VKNSIINVFNLNPLEGNKSLISTTKTDSLGRIKLGIENNKEYLIQVLKEDYLTEEITLKKSNYQNDSIIKRKVELENYLGKSIVVENIYYNFDKTELTQKAKTTIDNTILKILIKNPNIIIELGSHTDHKGDANYNETLSQGRAKSVVDYLITQGIDQKRLIAKGYGEEQPIAPNLNEDGSDNPEGRLKNRRTEFRVIGKIDAKINYLK
jgi:outer membrane protein OmpA-like peptidoglycan-associated protein